MWLSSAVHFYYALYCGTTDFAEVIGAREHDAVDFRTVVTARFIHRSLERADFPKVFLRLEHLLLVRKLFLE